jgi:hypothetical protein
MSPAVRFSALTLALCGAAIVPRLAAQAGPATLQKGNSFSFTASRFLIDGTGSDFGLTALTLRYRCRGCR